MYDTVLQGHEKIYKSKPNVFLKPLLQLTTALNWLIVEGGTATAFCHDRAGEGELSRVVGCGCVCWGLLLECAAKERREEYMNLGTVIKDRKKPCGTVE